MQFSGMYYLFLSLVYVMTAVSTCSHNSIKEIHVPRDIEDEDSLSNGGMEHFIQGMAELMETTMKATGEIFRQQDEKFKNRIMNKRKRDADFVNAHSIFKYSHPADAACRRHRPRTNTTD